MKLEYIFENLHGKFCQTFQEISTDICMFIFQYLLKVLMKGYLFLRNIREKFLKIFMKLTLTLESFYAKLRHNLYENNIEV